MRQYIVLIVGLLSCAFFSARAQQAILETYGQNRIQGRVFKWQYYDSAHFRVFYYDHGKHNAQYILQQAELDFPGIVGEMGVRMPRKINIILYNSFTDYKQTNTGRYNEELNLSNNSVVDISGNNVVVYFNGSHDDLRQQVKKGVVGIIKDNLLFGFKLKDIVQNAVKLRLPLWYTSGYVQYQSSQWNAQRNSAMRSMLQGGNPKAKFDFYAERSPEIVGHSFFNFIEKKYNKSYINNLFYLTSNRKAINKALEIVLQKKASAIYEEWKQYYLNAEDSAVQIGARKLMFAVKPKPNAVISSFALSPEANIMAYCESLDGRYQVKLYDTKNKGTVVILEGALRQSLALKDPSYPLMCWNADGKKLAIMYEQDYMQRLKVYDAKNGRISDRIILPNRFDRLQGLSFMEDDDKLVITAIRKGQCDMYQYVIKNAMLVNITKDIWDDLSPQYINNAGMRGVLFMSNRPQPYTSVKLNNGELPNTNPNIFFYDDDAGSSTLMQYTKEQDVDITQPIQYGPDKIAFLAEIGGTCQRIIAHTVANSKGKDSIYYTISNPSNYNIKAHGFNAKKGMCFDVIEHNGTVEVYSTPYKQLDSFDEKAGYTAKTYAALGEMANIKIENVSAEPSSFFLTDFTDDVDSMQLPEASKNKVFNKAETGTNNATTTTATKPLRSKPYTATFNTDFLQTSVDNNLIFDRYQNLSTGNGTLATPPLGALLKMSLIDYMEDYKLTAAMRIPLLDQGVAYQLKFANYRRLLDWEVQAVYNKNVQDANLSRDTVNFSPVPEQINQIQTYLQGMISYPFSVTTSLRLTTGIRQDKQRYKALSEYSINFPTTNQYWSFTRLEYVYDNSFSPWINIRVGTRVKVYQEAFIKLNGANANMFNSGLDVRHYQKLYRNAIFAIRLNTAHSFGTAPMLYKLGGVDNAVLPGQYNVNTDNINNDTTKFGFQSQVTSMRGYYNNARQGSSYALISAEVRIPIVNTILNRRVRSNFLNSLQLVPFIDVAAAGRGFLDIENRDSRTLYASNRNSFIYSQNNVSTTAQGIGMGARAVIGSYFVRLDVAKGVDRARPFYHISLSQDF
jgi:hypothetical protein